MASPYPRAKYIISRYSDPIFAVFIGFSAALLRIRKEEIEKRSGIPSASMVISPQQQKLMDEEREKNRSKFRARTEMYRTGDGGSSESDVGVGQDGSWLGGTIPYGIKRQEVGYVEILKMGWQRIVWKVDYEWNGKAKDLIRKDGRVV